MTMTPQTTNPSMTGTIMFQKTVPRAQAAHRARAVTRAPAARGGPAEGRRRRLIRARAARWARAVGSGAGGRTGGGGATGAGGTGGGAGAGGERESPGRVAPCHGPCDIYKNGGTPCVAAHSTVRALFGAYGGKLYQVRAGGTTLDIRRLTPGGVADGAAQEAFCAGTTCVITVLYDQSGKGNDLWYQGSTGAGLPAEQARRSATESLMVGGQQGLLALHQPREQLLARWPSTGVPTGSPAPRGVHGDQRHALQRWLLLRLRQQRKRPEGRRCRRDGRDLLRIELLVPRGAPTTSADPVHGCRRTSNGGFSPATAARPGTRTRFAFGEHVRQRHAQEQRYVGVQPQGAERGPDPRALLQGQAARTDTAR